MKVLIIICGFLIIRFIDGTTMFQKNMYIKSI